MEKIMSKTKQLKDTANTSRVPGSGSFRDFERGNADVGRGELMKVPLHRIVKREGFNPRDLSKPETVEKIAAIKEAYKSGQYVPAIEVRLESKEKVSIVNGECRYTAALQADAELKAEGQEGVGFLMCVPFKGSDEDCLMMTVTSNAGEKLTVLELSVVVRRAIDTLNLPKTHIAKKLSWSASYIDKLEAISNLAHPIKDLIRDDKISVDVALDAVKKHGAEGAVDVLRDYVTRLAETGKPKVTTSIAKQMAANPAAGTDGDPAAVAAAQREAAPKKKVSPKKVVDIAKDMVHFLPDLEYKVESISDTRKYSVKVPGTVLKRLLELQAMLGTDEDEDDDGDGPAPEQGEVANGNWPFKPKGEDGKAAP
jgi:hypothetical protein